MPTTSPLTVNRGLPADGHPCHTAWLLRPNTVGLRSAGSAVRGGFYQDRSTGKSAQEGSFCAPPVTVSHSAWFRFGVEPAGTRDAFPGGPGHAAVVAACDGAAPAGSLRVLHPAKPAQPAPGTGASTASMWPSAASTCQFVTPPRCWQAPCHSAALMNSVPAPPRMVHADPSAWWW